MISVVIATLNSAPHLVRALGPLVSGVAEGLVKEAIVADAGSSDDTVKIAEGAGCTIVRGGERAGAGIAKGDWLLFLKPSVMLEAGWIEEARRFTQRGRMRAAAFRFALDDDSSKARRSEFIANAAAAMLKAPREEQGLLISRALYDSCGGWGDDYSEFVHRIGGARLFLLRTAAVHAN
ncbi:MAG: glycosyltransferase [Caulobacterales bacterium]